MQTSTKLCILLYLNILSSSSSLFCFSVCSTTALKAASAAAFLRSLSSSALASRCATISMYLRILSFSSCARWRGVRMLGLPLPDNARSNAPEHKAPHYKDEVHFLRNPSSTAGQYRYATQQYARVRFLQVWRQTYNAPQNAPPLRVQKARRGHLFLICTI